MVRRIALLVAAMLAGLALFAIFRKSGPTAGVSATELRLTGTIEARETDVAPEIGGAIVSLAVEEGQPVKKGDVIALLSDREVMLRLAHLEARVAAARAEVESLRAPARASAMSEQRSRIKEAGVAVEQARANLARALHLREREATSQVEVDAAAFAVRAAAQRAQTEHKTLADLDAGARPAEIVAAELRVDEQVREVDIAHLELERTRIVAPVDGVVVHRHFEPGEIIAAGQPLVTLIDSAHLWVELAADERLHGALRVGQSASVRPEVAPGEVVHGRVSYVAGKHAFTPRPAQTRDERAMLMFRVKVAIEQAPPTFKPGMFVDVTVQTRDEHAP